MGPRWGFSVVTVGVLGLNRVGTKRFKGVLARRVLGGWY